MDDDPVIRHLIRQSLEDEGGSLVVCVANGAEALAYLHESPKPSLILLDLVMPLIDGLEFRRAQLGDPIFASIPVVVMTASERRVEASGMAATAVLLKPFSAEELRETVHRIC